MCDLSGQELSKLNVTYRDPNWGRKKGGQRKVAIHGCNLTMHDRIKGGATSGRSNSHEHMKVIASIGGATSAKSFKNGLRRVVGPDGVRMYNGLERDTLDQLVRGGFNVDYEPVITLGSRRLIPDFRVGSTYIECTGNPKANVKAPKLLERFQLLKGQVPFRKGIVVTFPSLATKYTHYLGSEVEVATLQDFLSRIPKR